MAADEAMDTDSSCIIDPDAQKRLADEKKGEGNQLYKLKQYRDALSKYSEAIGNFFNHNWVLCSTQP